MRFLEFKEKLSDQLVFTSNDIKKIDDNFSYRRLSEWQKKDYITKIIKGYYIFSDTELNEEVLFSIANKIYKPSYISLESALDYYNFIPEGVFKIISISTKKTNEFDTKIGDFKYRNIKPAYFSNYIVIGKKEKKIKIASPEKAIVDYFYFAYDIKTKDDIRSLRFNKNILQEEVDPQEIKKIAKKIGNKSLSRRINKFLSINYA